MRPYLRLFLLILIAPLWSACVKGQSYQGTDTDRQAIEKTGEVIRTAFARGNIDEIMRYHHPDVIKALSPTAPYQVGSAAVKAGLADTFKDFSLTFTTSHVDNLYLQGDTAVETSTFTIQGMPKHGGQPFVFKGRSLVVYVRFNKSPSGWASIREMIQPAS